MSGDGSDDPTPRPGGPFTRAARKIRKLHERMAKLEQNRAMRGDFIATETTTLSPIERIADRMTIGDEANAETTFGPTSYFIDTFEDADMSEYDDPANAATIMTDYPVYRGSHSVNVESGPLGGRDVVTSVSGLSMYPQEGDVFDYRLYLRADDAIGSFYFGCDTGSDNGYRVDVDYAGNDLALYVVSGGSATELERVALSNTPTGEWLQVEVGWSSGFAVKVRDESGVSLATEFTSDTTYTAGGIGYAAEQGVGNDPVNAYYDTVRITDLGRVIDDLEDADVAEYNGDTGSATVENKATIPVSHGVYGLSLQGGSTTIQTPAGNLNTDASPGDSFLSNHYLSSGSRARFLWGVQDGSNYYYAEVDVSSDEFEFGVVNGGTQTAVSTSTSGFTVPTDEWVQIYVEWDTGGAHTVALVDEQGSVKTKVNGSDATFTSGGHGWAERGSTESFHDEARLAKKNLTPSAELVIVGSRDNTLYAVDASTGNQEWAFTQPGDDVVSSPTVVNGTAYVGSRDNTLYAVDASTGNQEWAFTQASDVVNSSPAVVNGTVYAGSENDTLYAVDASSGNQEWAFTQASGAYSNGPTFINGTVYALPFGGPLYSIDGATGNKNWEYTNATPISSPTVVNGTVYVGGLGGNLIAVDAATGGQKWVFTQPGGALESSPTVVNGTVYVGANDNTLYAVDASTGNQEWAFTQPSEAVESSPAVVNGTVYVGANDNTLYAVDASTGNQEWAFTQASDVVNSSPTVVNGTVYVGSRDTTLYAVDASTGNQEWAFTQPSGGVRSSPTVVGGATLDSIGTRCARNQSLGQAGRYTRP